MDTRELHKRRREKLQRYITEMCGGNKSEFARRVDRKQSYISELLNGKRSFGEKIARDLEHAVKGLSLVNVEDELEKARKVAEDRADYAWPFSFNRRRFDRLTDTQKQKIEGAVVSLILEFEGHRASTGRKRRAAS